MTPHCQEPWSPKHSFAIFALVMRRRDRPGGSLAAGKASGYPSAADFYGREEIVGLPVCPEGLFGLKDSFHQRKLFATTSKTLTLSGQSLPGELFDKAMNARSSALPGLTLEIGYYF
ncbi:uncharacterized protein RAG0_00194 [Rhynchosporium agropyri]|uniref:Uncharacterized protein n=1 Tax=Rhynchosporium agropyri TaxID=914238 RepID=A0A1E1JRP4_9HELO|nr:uncharacterized protein RAG0_00194 [Rhynchosporium agropyri]